MKKISLYSILALASLIFFSCKDDKYIFPGKGNAAFSLSPTLRGNGKVSETTAPASVLLSITDSKGNVQENIILSLFAFGESYLSENLELQSGSYELTQFAVLDASNKVIYATPLEDSPLAHYVSDPLPMEFTINNDENTQVIPQVLAVEESDSPEGFGYASFGFEVVKPRLKILTNYIDDYPREQFRFFYDENGRLTSYDRYGLIISSGYKKLLHFEMEYGLENSNTFYTVTVWSIANEVPDTIASRRKVYLDVNSNFVRDIRYDYSGSEIIQEYIYTYHTGGFEVKERARRLNDKGKLSIEFYVTRIAFDTDESGNMTRQRIYNSHIEGANVEERIEREYTFTHDSNPNPLYKFHPYFASVMDWGRYPDSFSKNNLTRITPIGTLCECTFDFTYSYQNGYPIDMSPGGFIGITKRTFEYY